MEWLNYHHLYYFWTVARTGSVARASDELRLSAPAISNQIRKLEESLGERLFERSGRRLILTDMGRLAMRYADEIFSLGREFRDTLKDIPSGRPIRFCVGIADVLPKLIAYRLLQPALEMKLPIRIICREDRPDHLLADLVLHELDVVLTDAPIGAGTTTAAYSRLLAESAVGFFVSDKVRRNRKAFPKCIGNIPLLLPTENTAFRRSLDEWFYEQNIRPNVFGEFADFALLSVFAEGGYGAFAAPVLVADQLKKQGFRLLGSTRAVKTRYYAISVERRVRHPAVAAICTSAQE
jgi:LysR family transcriptional activator of nhaA